MCRRYKRFIIILCAVLLYSVPGYSMEYATGRVVDLFTKWPLQGAVVTAGDEVVLTDENGLFHVNKTVNKVSIRAYGYLRAEQVINISATLVPVEIGLIPFTPRALYLTPFGIGIKTLRESALKLIEETELNALVIDVKGDRGYITYKSSIPLASQIGAQKIILVKDMKGMMKSLKEKNVYTIARIVVFKDELLAPARPDLAIKTLRGAIWHDREDLAWTDPFKKEVWDYNIDIAVEAAQQGFDEIQFDYVRFPDEVGPLFSMPNTEENRINAISGFLTEAKRRLAPYNVFLGADFFGYVCWNPNDTRIGQKLEDFAADLDYLSPMLYPSGFQYGIPGYRNPVAHPYEIVYLSLKKAMERTHLPPIRFRPWLQAFRDYAFDKRYFKGQEIREQINAAEKFGSDGWMLWNPHNIYSDDGLKK